MERRFEPVTGDALVPLPPFHLEERVGRDARARRAPDVGRRARLRRGRRDRLRARRARRPGVHRVRAVRRRQWQPRRDRRGRPRLERRRIPASRCGSSTSPRRASVPPRTRASAWRSPRAPRSSPAPTPTSIPMPAWAGEMRASVLGGLDLVVGKPVPRRDQAPLRRGEATLIDVLALGGEPGRAVSAQQPGTAVPRAVPAVHRREPGHPRPRPTSPPAASRAAAWRRCTRTGR